MGMWSGFVKQVSSRLHITVHECLVSSSVQKLFSYHYSHLPKKMLLESVKNGHIYTVFPIPLVQAIISSVNHNLKKTRMVMI